MSYHRGGQTGSVAVSYSTSPMAPHSPSRRYSSGSTSSSTTTSGVGGGGGGGGGGGSSGGGGGGGGASSSSGVTGSGGSSSSTSKYNYTSRDTPSSLRDRSSIYSSSPSSTIPSLRSSYVSDCRRSYCQTGRSSYGGDTTGIGGSVCSTLANGISSIGSSGRYTSSTSSSYLSSSTASSRDRTLESSALRRDINADIIGRCSPLVYVPSVVRHSSQSGTHRWKQQQHSKAATTGIGGSSLNELIGGEEHERKRTGSVRPESSLSSSSSSSSSSAITGGGLWSRSKGRPPIAGSTVLTTGTGHARAHSATSSVEVTIAGHRADEDDDDDEIDDDDDIENDDDDEDEEDDGDVNDDNDYVNDEDENEDETNERDNNDDDDNNEDDEDDENEDVDAAIGPANVNDDDDDDEDDDRRNDNNNNNANGNLDGSGNRNNTSSNSGSNEEDGYVYEQLDYNDDPRRDDDDADNNRINRHHHQRSRRSVSNKQRISVSPTAERNVAATIAAAIVAAVRPRNEGGAGGGLIPVNLDLLTNLANTNPNNTTEHLIDNDEQSSQHNSSLQSDDFEIDDNEVIRGVNEIASIEPVDTYRRNVLSSGNHDILDGLSTKSNSPVNPFDIEENDFEVRTLYTVLQNGLSGRNSDDHSDDPSVPSTSSRQEGHFSGIDRNTGASASGGLTSSSPATPNTRQQSLYRAGNEQFEGSPTNRPVRNPFQAHRDERCGLNGLRNIGNTCFMNSVIQCLSNTRPLLEYVMNEYYLVDINTTTSSMKGALIKAFSQVIQELWQVDGDHVVNTLALKSQIQRFTPRFMGYSQQDAQEFLRYLLEGLHEDVNRVTIKPQPIHTDIPDMYTDSEKAAESWKRYLRSEDSMVVDLFVGQLRSSLRCTFCDHVSVTLDPFWDLSLPIPARSGTVKLSQCLEHFTREEVLDGDEKPTCSKCQMRRKCTKSFGIQKFPKILVIHLKRFSPMERFRGKLNVMVDFPLMDLDLSAFAAPRVPGCTYNLYGVANHSGTTYSGHYTAYCKHPYSGEWHEYNDSHVSGISAKSVVSSEAYVLFYEQQPHSSHL
ncbi:probable serine/threonine-protein kinase DDB_G0282963 isoform X2 [Vespa mandarinia]|uniref:probable serine/threonine-protein kinase DDB_G0282963 isoform X2 n=1 Tax=Vespa mandarinia TaxID=7446 RepID=UPI00160B3CA4|nr:probable serine/threonine-protein kinase DDB_G0282963 isoform X2 [Vespa mandarinia]